MSRSTKLAAALAAIILLAFTAGATTALMVLDGRSTVGAEVRWQP